MKRISTLTVAARRLQRSVGVPTRGWTGARRRRPIRISRSAITIASTPRSSSRTPCRSPIPSTTSCSASSLGDPQPANFSPLYKGQVLVHGMGFSPDHHTLAVVVDRLEFGDLHRHRDQCRQAHHLCRPLAARGVLHAGRQGSLGDGARRELRLRARRHDLRGKDADHRAERAGHDRSSRRTANTAMSARRSIRRPTSSRSPTTRSSARSSRPARSVPTSRRRPTASRSGSR